MSRILRRIGRVIARLVRPILRLSRTARTFAWLLTLGTGGAVTLDLRRAQPWLSAGWTHWALVVFIVLSVTSSISLFNLEAQLEEATTVLLSTRGLAAEIFPLLNYMDFGGGQRVAHNVLTVRFELRMRNNGSGATRALFPELRLLKAGGPLRRKEVVESTPIEVGARAKPRGDGGIGEFWLEEQGIHLPAKEEIRADFWLTAPLPESGFAQGLSLRFVVDVFGQELKEFELALPRPTLRD